MTGRKKSIASSGPNGGLPQIDTGVVNTLLKKPGSSAVPLYQQCTALRARLMRVHGFQPFLAASISGGAARQSTDPVHRLWDCLALGHPLVFLFNLLPISASSQLPYDKDKFEDPKERKRAIALFIIGIGSLQKIGEWEEGDLFTVSDLLRTERNTNGFVKVVATVTTLLDRIPEACYMPEPRQPSLSSAFSEFDGPKTDSLESLADSVPESAREAARKQVIAEILDTERKFVQDLEVMQNFATALSTQNLMSQDTIHSLFLNVNALLDFQRHFLIAMEGVYEQKWPDQRWGYIFTLHEEAFEVYEPYCANYTSASELLQAEEQTLMALAHMIHPKSELPAFLIKPVQRICKYPLLLESLAKRSSPEDYPYHQELLDGWAATKRITDRVNEAQRRAENQTTCKALEARVQDWKGHHINNFGLLLLDDVFIVNKAEVDREYHVFLFEKIILCCKESSPVAVVNGRKVGKSNSILKKNSGTPLPPALNGPGRKNRTTPLQLKGRIFLNNVTKATPARIGGQHGLQVWWRGDDDLEYFTLQCRTEEQLKQWETNISRLIRDIAARTTERSHSSASNVRPPPSGYMGKSMSVGNASPYSPSLNGNPRNRSSPLSPPTVNTKPPNGKDLNAYFGASFVPAAPRPTYDDEGFVEDEYDESPVLDDRSSQYDQRGNSHEGRRSNDVDPRRATSSHPGDGYRPPNGLIPARMPMPPRLGSEASFGPGVQATRGLRSQFSSTRLKSGYELGEEEAQRTRAVTSASQSGRYTPSPIPPQHLRMRSASTPTAYNQQQQQYPAPAIPQNGWASASASQSSLTSAEEKRGSGSSQSTDRSSDYSANNHSPASPNTAYGSSESTQLRSGLNPMYGLDRSNPPVKVKVHYREDLFVIVVNRATEYHELVDKVGKKIRLCGGMRDDAPLKVKYRDEDGDMISLGSDEDVQMAFDTGRANGSPVTLYVV